MVEKSLFTSSMLSFFFLLQRIYRARGIRAVEESTVTSAIVCVSLTQISYNMIDEQLNAVCRTQTFTYTYWLLHDFSNQCEDARLEDGPNFSDLSPFLLCSFIYCEVSQEHNFHVIAKLTVLTLG